MTKFISALQAETNLTYTENMGVTNKSTLSPIVDYFSLAGAMRNNPEGSADLFEKAFRVDPQTAVRTLFYLRDVRGGQGERDVFYAGWERLCRVDEIVAEKLLQHIPEYGRWDDLFHTPINFGGTLSLLVMRQLRRDLLALEAGQPVSLLAKWMPSENTSSPQTKRTAQWLRAELGYTSAEYRRTLSKLRRRIHLLEQDMSSNNWNEIDFGKLPSQAHRKHVKAFQRRTPERYRAYLDSVEKGEAKINVSTVYPYEIYEMIHKGWVLQDNQYANVAWENLPNYAGDSGDALVMADVSGSMTGRPMSVSVSLALYFAERNKGAYQGYYMSFSGEPALHQVHGATLAQRMNNIQSEHVGYNTDLSKAFRAILAAAKSSGEVPEVLYIISDMEFDAATSNGYGYFNRPAAPAPQDTIFRTAKQEFAQAGFELPAVVFWNVNARNMQAPATILDGQVSLVSGCSPTVFGMAVQGKSPLDLVYDVVNSDRYARIAL
jgi:hypothetical protein